MSADELSIKQKEYLEKYRVMYIEEKNKESELISDRIKTFAPSIIAINWILIGIAPLVVNYRHYYIQSAGFALLVLFFDFLQYLSGYFEAKIKICEAKSALNNRPDKYIKIYTDNNSLEENLWIKAKNSFFYIKICLIILSVTLLSIGMFKAFS